MKNEILVSVIIPARNSEKYLGACLQSVLEQEFSGFEVVVVDNNSTDRTKEIILDLAQKHQNLKYVFEPKIGRGFARNAGINSSTGEIIAMTDSDCIVPPNWLREITKPIREDGESIVMGLEESASDNYWSKNIQKEQDNFFVNHIRGSYIDFIDTKNFAINSRLMRGYRFDENLKSLEDFDLAFRIKRHHQIKFLPNLKVKHFHKDNFASWARLQVERGFWLFKIFNKHKKERRSIKNEKMMASINLVNTVIFPIWLLKQAFAQPINRFPFIITSEIAWRMGLLGGIFQKLFGYPKSKVVRETPRKEEKLFTETITALVPVRSRYDYRIRNCLKSLRSQTYNQTLLKIIIIDYGSDEKYKIDFEELCKTFDAKGIWTGLESEVWNKSKCLNIGLKSAESRYLIVADVDVIFERNYLKTCVEIAEKFKGEVGLYPRIFDCPKGLVNSEIDPIRNFENLVKRSVYRGDKYGGNFPYGVGILFASVRALKEIGGYDEFYTGWGFEDLDMLKRLQSFGAGILSLALDTRAVHQWHPKNEGLVKDRNLARQIKLNQQYCENNFSIKRNGPRDPTLSPKVLPGTIWGITCFFNPAQYENKYESYQIFRRASKRQGLKLVTVELAFGNKPFELGQTDAEISVQIRGDEENVIWQKETLLNLAIKHLPSDCDKFVWLDCDIIFADDNWIAETSRLLERYMVVQPFENAIRMLAGIKSLKEHLEWEQDNGPAVRSPSFASVWSNRQNEMISNEFFKYEPGFACAFRREIFEKIRFYDWGVLGTADSIMFRAFCGWRHFNRLMGLSPGLINRQDDWSQVAFRIIQGSVSFVTGEIFHIWHGDLINRRYVERDNLLRITNFDPNRDVRLNHDGILEWTTNNRRLKFGLKEYFTFRNEDGKGIKYEPLWIVHRNTKISKPKDGRKLNFNRLGFSFWFSWRLFLEQKGKFSILNLWYEYNKAIGLIGQKIRAKNPGLYYQLKKYFPDR